MPRVRPRQGVQGAARRSGQRCSPLAPSRCNGPEPGFPRGTLLHDALAGQAGLHARCAHGGHARKITRSSSVQQVLDANGGPGETENAQAAQRPSLQPARLTASGWQRAMGTGESGGSQPHVFHTEDGPYLVKVSNNPQGSRVLPNDLVGGLCLDWLGVKHPRTAIVDIPESVIEDSPGACFQDGARLAAGLAVGSKLVQSDPGGTVPVDLIANPRDVAGTLAYDHWVRNHDGRQYRVRPSETESAKYDFVPVDQGHSFGPPEWTVPTLDADRNIVANDSGVPVRHEDIHDFADRLRQFSDAHTRAITDEIPDAWLSETERDALRRYLLERASLSADELGRKYPRREGANG